MSGGLRVKLKRALHSAGAVFAVAAVLLIGTPRPDLSAVILTLHIGCPELTVEKAGRKTTVALYPAPEIPVGSGRTFLPIEPLVEAAGGLTSWCPEHQRVEIQLGDREVVLWIGRNTGLIGGSEVPVDPHDASVQPYVLPPGPPMLPLRFVAEALGAHVEWDDGLSRATITIGGPVPPRAPPEIRGDDDFVQDTRQALALLEERAPAYYDLVVEYIRVVEQVERGSGIRVAEKRFFVGKATVKAGTTWYAGVLVHDAAHSKLYHDYLRDNPGTSGVPREVHSGRDAEAICLSVQYKALLRLVAPRYILEHVMSALDREYWLVPQSERGW